MALANYRIADLSIEYFKGFAAQQTLSFDGRNVFLFGENGHGKSSIIEAIRWCLFGTSDVEVRNIFYEREVCRVSIELKGEGGNITIERELRPGRNRSEFQITNDRGDKLKFGDVLPQIAKLGAHESAQVIFAAQQAESRSVRPNITDFGKVLFFYLKLEDVPDLIKTITEQLQEQQSVTEAFGKRIEVIAERYRQKQASLQVQINMLLANPPWGEGSAPAANETDHRIVKYVRDLSGLLKQAFPADLSPGDLLEKADERINQLTAKELATFQQELGRLSERIEQAESLIAKVRDTTALAARAEARHRDLENGVAELLAGRTREQLVVDLRSLEAEQTAAAAFYWIAEQVARLCDDHDPDNCPACGSKFKSGELARRVTFQLGASATSLGTDSSELENARTTLRAVDEAIAGLALTASEVSNAHGRYDAALRELTALMGDGEKIALTDAEVLLTEWENDRVTRNRNQADQRNEKQQLQSRIKGYRQELSYHRYRDQKKELDRMLNEGMEEVQRIFHEHQDYVHQVDELRALVESAFRNAIDRAIPRLNDLLTTVYLRLTHQRSFEIVKVYHHPERVGQLDVMVATKRQPDINHSADKLNGQAKKAIHLVPYFVFSRLFQAKVMELELLLIDDPSESFDTSHVGFLVEELRFASEHAQVIAASHEKDKFSPQVAKYFGPDSYLTMTVRNFDPDAGPEIA